MTIKDDIYEEDVIVDKPSKNEDNEEIPSSNQECTIEEKFHQYRTTHVDRNQVKLGAENNTNQF